MKGCRRQVDTKGNIGFCMGEDEDGTLVLTFYGASRRLLDSVMKTLERQRVIDGYIVDASLCARHPRLLIVTVRLRTDYDVSSQTVSTLVRQYLEANSHVRQVEVITDINVMLNPNSSAKTRRKR